MKLFVCHIWGALVGASLLAGCNASDTAPVSKACLQESASPVEVKGGEFKIGNERAYPEERPVRIVQISDFEIDATEVTNAQFAKFVRETSYVTTAEKPQAGFDKPGAAVFKMPTATEPRWWLFVEGANWRQPEGPGSAIDDKANDPVVQVSFADAIAYADWAGRRLPNEAEWEVAAKAGTNTVYPWGDDLRPGGKDQANTWQGAFPVKNTTLDGHFLRAPVGCFAANQIGLYDMIGNVWEWTDSVYQVSDDEPVHVIKGGSFLCAENYCRRYRATARQPQEAGFSTNHIGFRTVKDADS